MTTNPVIKKTTEVILYATPELSYIFLAIPCGGEVFKIPAEINGYVELDNIRGIIETIIHGSDDGPINTHQLCRLLGPSAKRQMIQAILLSKVYVNTVPTFNSYIIKRLIALYFNPTLTFEELDEMVSN